MTTPENEFGTPHFVTAGPFLRIPPRGAGRNRDFYGVGKPIPDGLLTEAQIQHFLAHSLIARSDGKGHVDHGREDEALCAVIACCADEEGSESWGRPRIAERLRANGYAFSNDTLSRAIKRFKNPLPEAD